MNTLKMKIVGFDEDSKSLLVSFASDQNASSNPEDYPAYAYQPSTMWPGVTDTEEIKFRLAYAGMYMAEQQAIKERLDADDDAINTLRSLVGSESVYVVNELIEKQKEEEENEYMYIDGSITGESPDVL
jgi:hypothetical protein